MPTILGPQLPISYPNSPPGMSAQDAVIWARFRPTILQQATHFYANVRVGGGQADPGYLDDAGRNLLQALTQHRLDLILQGPQLLWLVEVRHNAGSGALGTILTNSALYNQDPILGRDYTRVILTNDIDDDSRLAIDQSGVLAILA